MGREVSCKVTIDGKPAHGKALLESDYVLFRGEPRLKIPFAAITIMEAKNGLLHVHWENRQAAFDLGPDAAKWLAKIRNPPTLLEKLGIRPGHRVALISPGAEPAAAGYDFILLFAEDPADLNQLGALRAKLQPAGAIWIVYPKGQKHITEAGVMASGKAAGLVDSKTCAFSNTHTGLKYVVPLAQRQAGA